MMKMSTSGCLFGAPIDGGGDREADEGGVDSVGRAYTIGRLRLPFVEHDRADGVESQPGEGARGRGGDRGRGLRRPPWSRRCTPTPGMTVAPHVAKE
jgi:hypothetical protein